MPKTSKSNDVDTLVAELNKKYDNAIRRPDQYPSVLRVPSSSPSFNYATGHGIPVNRWTRFWGDQQTGKSITAWDIIAQAQNIHTILPPQLEADAELAKETGNKDLAKRLIKDSEYVQKTWPEGMSVVFYNIENGFDPEFIERKGINPDTIKIVEGNEIEQTGEILENLVQYDDFHVIDSASAAITIAELEMDIEEQRRGVDAKQWAMVLRRVNNKWSENNIGIIVDQVRVNQTDRWVELEPKGGRFAAHMPKMTINFKRASWLYKSEKGGFLTDKKEQKDTMSEQREPDGIEVLAYVDKNQVGKPFRSARMRLDTDAGAIWDINFELKRSAVFYGLYEQAGPYYYRLNAEGERTDQKFLGEAQLRDHFDNDQEARDRIFQEIRRHTKP